jgi:hypothetical protein
MSGIAEEVRLNLQKLVGLKLSRIAPAADMKTLSLRARRARNAQK